ncbi:MAG: HPr(Ser) kinase/phosphatase [Acidobacteria bacterium]|nr:MAG: HPr(Ser) kinase/phosphatase [Acidobacteriota bacterium]
MQTTSQNAVENPTITVGAFVAGAPPSLPLSFLAGARGAESRVLRTPRIQKLGLALAGFPHYVHEGRVQIVGQSELQFLGQLSPAERREAVAKLELEKISCVLVTKGLTPPAELVEAAERASLPLIQTPLVSSVAIGAVTEYLEEALAPRELRHGVLLDLYGLGVLIEGKSGVGKSECALDLIMRGHQLVADDLVEVRRTRPGQLTGSPPDLLREHMEIRGLGIVNVRELFGASAISGPKQIDLDIRPARQSGPEPRDARRDRRARSPHAPARLQCRAGACRAPPRDSRRAKDAARGGGRRGGSGRRRRGRGWPIKEKRERAGPRPERRTWSSSRA